MVSVVRLGAKDKIIIGERVVKNTVARAVAVKQRSTREERLPEVVGAVGGASIRMGRIRFEGGILPEDPSWGWTSITRAASTTPVAYGEILSFGKVQRFPTRRRPEQRQMSNAADEVVET